MRVLTGVSFITRHLTLFALLFGTILFPVVFLLVHLCFVCIFPCAFFASPSIPAYPHPLPTVFVFRPLISATADTNAT